MTQNKFTAGNFSALLAEKISSNLSNSLKKSSANNDTYSDEIKNEKIAKLESLLDLYSELHQQSADCFKIKIEHTISKDDFYKSYYYLNRPVVIKGMLGDCAALVKWCPDFFVENFGSVPIEITTNRNNGDYEKNFAKTVQIITMKEFVELIKNNPDTNNFYLVARNYFFSNPLFQCLKEDLKPPAEIIDSSYTGFSSTKLWFGPKGTVTPLHHDKHSILFAQIFGRKHFKMIPSFEINKVYNQGDYYSPVDPENFDAEKYPKFLQTSLIDVVLEPGDLLFIPVGWWHWVKSLEVSISVTFSNFYVKNYNTEWKCK